MSRLKKPAWSGLGDRNTDTPAMGVYLLAAKTNKGTSRKARDFAPQVGFATLKGVDSMMAARPIRPQGQDSGWRAPRESAGR